jgi:hypothetical protein
VQIEFQRIARGPAWERWIIEEGQHGDAAYAGHIVITYSDTTTDAVFEADVVFLRPLSEDEMGELLDGLSRILCNEGCASIYTGDEVARKCFCPDDEDDFDDDETLN